MIRHLSALALAAIVAFAAGEARAASVTFVGTFEENLLSTDDITFSFMSSDASIFVSSVTLNLTASDGVVFDPPFAVEAEGGTGFDGMFQFDPAMPQLVTLNFGDFGTGEMFSFSIDADPGFVRGAEFENSTATITLNTGEMFSGSFQRQSLFTARVQIDAETQGQVPEPASIALLGLGLSGLALRMRGRS